jgi:hypothetical protein
MQDPVSPERLTGFHFFEETSHKILVFYATKLAPAKYLVR